MSFMAKGNILILRKPRSDCLEGRTVLIQLLVVSASGKHDERFAEGCI
jgi:hypothetical protein